MKPSRARARTKRSRKTPKAPKSHGGRRSGAGRKASRLPEDAIKELGPQPVDPLKVPKWNRQLSGILLEGLARGLDWRGLAQAIDRLQKTNIENLKLEVQFSALAERLNDDEDSDEDTAPRPIPRERDTIARTDSGALRRDPS